MATKVTSNVIADNAVTDAKLHSDFTATTQSASDNSTSVATTAYVTTAIANLSDSAPGTLNTLNELAAALNDDASFSTTVTNSIATKLPLAGGTLTGHLRTNSTFGVNLTTTVGVGGTPADANTVELGPGYLNLARDDTASAKQITFGKNGAVHSFIETTSSGLNIGGANVGIGTTTPAKLLHIKSADPVIRLEDSSPSAYAEIDGAGGDLIISCDAGDDDSNSVIKFKVDNSEKVQITSDGHVGIGMTPAEVGSDTILSIYDSTSPRIKLHNSTSGTASGDGAELNTYNSDFIIENREAGNVRFFNNGSERMRIDTDGRLAIANTTTAADSDIHDHVKLVVAGGAVVGSAAGADNSFLQYSDAGGLTVLQGSGTYGLRVFDDNSATPRFTVMRSGNVGIATTSPGFKLTIGGGIGANQSTAYASMTGRLGFGNDYSDTQRGPNKIVLQNDGSWIAGIGVSNGATDFYTGGHFTFSTGTSLGSEKMRINSTGYVGVGTDSPAFLGLTGSGTSRVLQVHGTNAQLRLTNSIIHHDNAGLTKLTIRNNYGATSNSAQMELQAGFITFETGTSFTERLRINSSGRQTYNSSGTANAHATFVGEVGVSFKALAFERTVGGGEVGTIVTNANGTVTYGGTSDYRLKENVDYTWDATSRLKQLKPARFNFIADDTNTLIDGFLAHEVSSIVPEAIVGEKDGMADPILYEAGDEIPEGKEAGDVKTPSVPEYQMMDNSKLVPLLVKTIQELEARLTAGGL